MNMNEMRSTRMARRFQSCLNGIWENEIINIVCGDEINMEELDILTRGVLQLEQAYEEMGISCSFNVYSNKIIHKCKYPGIPRRFEVEYKGTKQSNSPLTVWKNFYKDKPIEKATFIMLYNAYNQVFKIGDIKDYNPPFELDYKKLKVLDIGTNKENVTVALLKDIDTKEEFTFNLTEHILTFIKN